MIDNDGSEQLILELEIPDKIQLINTKNKGWVPRKYSIINQRKIYEVLSGDIGDLKIADNGLTIADSFKIIARYNSYEMQNMDKAVSVKKEIYVPFHRNALPAIVNTDLLMTVREDTTSIDLSDIIKAKAENPSDTLSYQIYNLQEGLSLTNKDGSYIK